MPLSALGIGTDAHPRRMWREDARQSYTGWIVPARGSPAMDHTFGKLITDPLKLTSHRANLSGLQHQHRISPRDPLPGDSVTVYALSASQPAIERMRLCYSVDGSDPRLDGDGTLSIAFERADSEWDTLLWDYVTVWTARIPGQSDGTLVSYCIKALTSAGHVIHADYPDAEERVQHATMIHFKSIPPDAPFTPSPQREAPLFCYHVDRLAPPAWVRDAIIYHIFLDRFYPGDGRDWLQEEDLQGFCGGTLWGARDKLDYLAELGVNCLWLSPTWRSASNHGYDVADYERIEPRLGGDEALHALVDGAHQRGIRVLLDLVCNHLSNAHPVFVDAARDERSPYRHWFHFDKALSAWLPQLLQCQEYAQAQPGASRGPRVDDRHGHPAAGGLRCRWLSAGCGGGRGRELLDALPAAAARHQARLPAHRRDHRYAGGSAQV